MASVCFITFFYTRPEPLWAGIGWNVLFMSVNLYQIGLLLLERRPVFLSEEEQSLHRLLFPTLTQREFSRLLQVADWHSCDDARQEIVLGEEPECVLLVSSGQMEVVLSENKKVLLGRGQFAGEMSFLAGGCANADVFVLPQTRYLRWPKAHLKKVLEDHPNLLSTMQIAWSQDLIQKLRSPERDSSDVFQS